jgi:hypothetical protein
MSEPGPEVMARFVGAENVERGREYLERIDPDALREAGVETFESCEGPAEHAYPEPTIRSLIAARRASVPSLWR